MKSNLLEYIAQRPTPLYCYDMGALRSTVHSAASAAERHGFKLHYALKANARPEVLEVMRLAGLGADCVSGAEVERAVSSGFHPSHIAFAGVGKTDAEIKMAIDLELFSINVESLEELEVIISMANGSGKRPRIALRLNPDVDAKTHHYITTGLEENKFGIGIWQLPRVLELLRNQSSLELCGIHFHIGSQIRSLEPFRNLCHRASQILSEVEDAGFRLDHINVGGGLGIDYERPDDPINPDFDEFFKVFSQQLQRPSRVEVHFELGRSLVANSGDLITRVLFVKKGVKTDFLILDAGMTELIRPALYQAVHRIENLSRQGQPLDAYYDVVGPVCESSDCFGKAVLMPVSYRGDVIAIRSAGAYGESMASHYNLRFLADPIFV